MSENPVSPLPQEKGIVPSKDVVAHLRSVEGTVRMDDPRVGAIHGTSLEAIEYLIANGVLPGRITREMHYRPGDISVYPTPQLANIRRRFISDDDYAQALANTGNPRGRAIGYAQQIAEEHGVLTALGFSVSKLGARWSVRDLRHVDTVNYLLSIGKTRENIQRTLEYAPQLRGFLLGFSPDIQHDPKISFTPGDSGEGDLNIRTDKRGLPYGYISVIEPLGEIEAEFLRNLKA